MRIIILLILYAIILLVGCSSKENEIISTTEITEIAAIKTAAETNTKPTEEITQFNAQSAYVEIPENALSQEESAELLRNRFKTYGIFEDDQHISFEGTTIINHREYYQFHRYDDFDDHRATLGWYAVNPVTGECLDTTTEPMPLYYRFEITEDGIEVYEKYNDVSIQLLELDPDYHGNHEWLYKSYQEHDKNPYDFIRMNDFDFDGYDDIEVWSYLGATNGTFQYFRYDPEMRQFEQWKELNGLYYGVTANITNKTLTVDSKNDAIDHYHDVYKWKVDTIYTVEKNRQYQNSEDGEVYIDYFECDEYGYETLVKRERVIHDENKKWLGTEEVEFK